MTYLLNQTVVAEFFEMCQNGALGHGVRLGGDVRVDLRDDLFRSGGAGAYGGQDVLFTLEPV
jgi:hypothetical protein